MPDPKDSKDNSTDSKDNKDNQQNSKDNQNGNPTTEDVKNLQKLISDKDVKLQNALLKISEFEKNSKEKDNKKLKDEKETLEHLHELVKGMTEELTTMREDKQRADLQNKYPDIVPETLLGKTEEEQKTIVEAQRKLSERLYGDSAKFTQPTYSSEDDVDKELEAVKKDTKLSGENAARKVLNLVREKAGFKK